MNRPFGVDKIGFLRFNTDYRLSTHMSGVVMGKKEDILAYLNKNVFDPILNSPKASVLLKQAIRTSLLRMNGKEAGEISTYYLEHMIGKDKPTKFAELMKAEGFTRFEEIGDEFKKKFGG